MSGGLTCEIDFAKLTMLVVEDQDYIRSLIVQLLRRLGVGTIIEQAGGAAALAVLRDANPDLVLCDVKMSPVDGLEFLAAVRHGRDGIRNPRVPVVFLTSDSERRTVTSAIQQEVDGYLIKPVSLNELKTKITDVLNKRQAG